MVAIMGDWLIGIASHSVVMEHIWLLYTTIACMTAYLGVHNMMLQVTTTLVY